MLSQTVVYALRAAAVLARRAPQPCTTQHIALATHIPKAYLAKVLQVLVQRGLVTSQRGSGGGMTLVLPPESVSVLDVVAAVAPITRIQRCPLAHAENAAALCALDRCLDAAAASVETLFARTTLADLVRPDPSAKQGCRFPAHERLVDAQAPDPSVVF